MEDMGGARFASRVASFKSRGLCSSPCKHVLSDHCKPLDAKISQDEAIVDGECLNEKTKISIALFSLT